MNNTVIVLEDEMELEIIQPQDQYAERNGITYRLTVISTFKGQFAPHIYVEWREEPKPEPCQISA